MHKQTKASRFGKRARERILERDKGCIFCQMAYHLPPEPQTIFDIMHIVNRSQGGLGVEENGALGCRWHHNLLDNGNKGLRAEMLQLLEKYMENVYPGWNKERLIYRKLH